MNVSRQTVSKWESGSAYPETDKLITLCDMFGCTLDELLRGNAEESFVTDTAGYDKEMNSFIKAVCAGTVTVLAGLVIMLTSYAFGLGEIIPTAVFLLFVAIGAAVFIVSGIRHGTFVKENPNIVPFYTLEQKKAFRRKFPVYIASGTVIVMLGVILIVITQAITPYGMTQESYDALCGAELILCVAVAAPLFIYGGMQYSKYEIEEYNKENAPDKPLADRIISAVSGGIMMLATIALFILGFCFDKWEICWIGYPIGGVLIGIVSIIFNNVKK